MKSLRVLCILLFAFIAVYNCSSGSSFEKSSTSTENEISSELVKSLVNYIDTLLSVKQIDFGESPTFESSTKPIQLTLEDGRLICTNGSEVVPIKILERTLVAQHAISSFYDIRVIQKMKEGNEENEILFPMKIKNSNNEAAMLVELLSPGSEGYIICLAANTEALLIPKIILEKAFTQYV